MPTRACCLGSVGSDVAQDAPPLGLRARGVRATVGLVFLGLAAWMPLWPLSLLAAWFGASHLVAAATGYRGCPELGAIPSFVLRRQVSTVCKPWDRLDRMLGAGGPPTAAKLTPTQCKGEAPDWSFGGTWPYKPKWFATDGIRIHYVDEGPPQGEPVVMLHGHPAWSFLYRRFIRGLAEAGFRAVAHDQIGFGRSDKPERVGDYTIQRNVQHFAALMDELALDGITLVLHDFGGPLGLAWAVEHPARVKRLVILNTFTGAIPAGAAKAALHWIKLMGAPGLGELLVKGARLPVRLFLLRMGIFHRERIGEPERAAYLAPHPTWASRAGLLAYPRLWPFDERSPTWVVARNIEDGLPELAAKPVLICRGLKDPGYQAGLLTLGADRFPSGQVHEFEDASHFLQEDAHERILPILIDFLRRT